MDTVAAAAVCSAARRLGRAGKPAADAGRPTGKDGRLAETATASSHGATILENLRLFIASFSDHSSCLEKVGGGYCNTVVAEGRNLHLQNIYQKGPIIYRVSLTWRMAPHTPCYIPDFVNAPV